MLLQRVSKYDICNKNCKILKILYTNICKFDCKYCVNTSKYFRKEKFTPLKLSKLFIRLYNLGLVKGLFLSSGICKDPDTTTEEMLEVVKLLREKYGFKGYIHFKILPGVAKDLIKRAAELSNRLSINLETPSESYLAELSSVKDFKIDLLRRLRYISKIAEKFPNLSYTTQFIVGASHENDLELLKRMYWLYSKFPKLRRCYFSAFEPIRGTPLEKKPAERKSRVVQLYRADFLIRVYKFKFQELSAAIDENGFFLEKDPKLVVYETLYKDLTPENASFQELLRIPGIGPKTARKLIVNRGDLKQKKLIDYIS
ncbi:MAG TPA: radical SAM protein [Candidatus Altiarchaeales archaeon]|nr:radical SAM protein [Candidatus Altiarchaeales archaeon]